MASEHELWAFALWVEEHHGDAGLEYIAEQVGRLATEGDLEGVAMWRKVADRFDLLKAQSTPS